ncbi:unnamed protein product, partial [Meganyctiphanes norvegica]
MGRFKKCWKRLMPCIAVQRKKQLAIENGSTSDISKPVDAAESQNDEKVVLVETHDEKIPETCESTSYIPKEEIEENHMEVVSEKFPEPGNAPFVSMDDVKESDAYGSDHSVSHYQPPESVPFSQRDSQIYIQAAEYSHKLPPAADRGSYYDEIGRTEFYKPDNLEEPEITYSEKLRRKKYDNPDYQEESESKDYQPISSTDLIKTEQDSTSLSEKSKTNVGPPSDQLRRKEFQKADWNEESDVSVKKQVISAIKPIITEESPLVIIAEKDNLDLEKAASVMDKKNVEGTVMTAPKEQWKLLRKSIKGMKVQKKGDVKWTILHKKDIPRRESLESPVSLPADSDESNLEVNIPSKPPRHTADTSGDDTPDVEKSTENTYFPEPEGISDTDMTKDYENSEYEIKTKEIELEPMPTHKILDRETLESPTENVIVGK